MKRLTKKTEEIVRMASTDDPDVFVEPSEMSGHDIRVALLKLAAYEDTGLEPEEIQKMKHNMTGAIYKSEDLASLAAICLEYKENKEKRKSGLTVDLPCKPGDKLYALTRDFVSVFRVLHVSITPRYMFCAWRLEEGIIGEHKIDGVWADAIGKDVFLTREAAEAALKRRKNETPNL